MKKSVGLVLGKFMPPHRGHMLLCQFAENYADELVIVVGTMPSEDQILPGALRYRWMCGLFPNAHVVHLHREMPQQPDEHPQFWQLWREALESVLPDGLVPTHVFASEPYCVELANFWNATPVLLDRDRSIIDISATKVRFDPYSCWQYLPQPVRQHYLKQVVLIGPECSGKSVLAQKLAAHFKTVFVPEVAKNHIALNGWPSSPEDMELFVKGQVALRDAASLQASKILINDTDPLTTLLWSQFLFEGQVTPYLEEQAKKVQCDLYLLTTPTDDWIDDVHRQKGLVSPLEFFQKARELLDNLGKAYEVIDSREWTTRLDQAVLYVDKYLFEGGK